jgi:hypothetical protein
MKLNKKLNVKHIKLFEGFISESSDLLLEDNYGANKADIIAKYIKENPKAKAAAQNCKTLWHAMRGHGTDEDAILSVFSKLKTKAELVQLIALWDLFDFSYNAAGGAGLGHVWDVITGKQDAFTKQVSNAWNRYPAGIKDALSSLDFWNKPETKNMDAWNKAREDFYKKNPQLRLTKLSYWLKEELDDEEIAKLNAIVKKFGMKF